MHGSAIAETRRWTVRAEGPGRVVACRRDLCQRGRDAFVQPNACPHKGQLTFAAPVVVIADRSVGIDAMNRDPVASITRQASRQERGIAQRRQAFRRLLPGRAAAAVDEIEQAQAAYPWLAAWS